jgi:cation:H+ antiporter
LQFNVSKDVIGLTVIALGTSLPELVTSAVAAKKGNSDIALGNIVGSNIFNVLLVLGATATINPVPVPFTNIIDLVILLGVSIYLAITARTGKKLTRLEGASYLVMYAAYLTYLFIRL